MSQTDLNLRQALASTPEDIFVELFSQAFGWDKALMLTHDHPVQDFEGVSRYIDFALRTTEAKIAFEIDGLTWHLPGAIPIAQYEDDLLRQNSLIHQGWMVFRWTDRQIQHEPERVKDQLLLFLERLSAFVDFDDFLPQQLGEVLELRPHQQEALDALAAMRAAGKTIALLTHATGTGKTIVAITDARRLGGRTLRCNTTAGILKRASCSPLAIA